MTPNCNSKQELRREIRRRKAACTPEQLEHQSAEVARRMLSNPRWQQAQTLLLYHSLPDEVATSEIDPAGNMRLDKKPLSLQQIKDGLTLMHAQKKDLVIHIRGDENTPYKHIAAVVDVCQKNGMTSLSLQTEFEPKQ